MIHDKYLYKIELYLTKVIPMIISALYLLNITLSYYDIDMRIFSILGGVSILPFIFLYISSIVFKFCSYHRMFIYYIGVCNIIDYIDYYIGIPLNERDFLIANLIIAGLFIFIILYLYLKYDVHTKRSNKMSWRKIKRT